MSFGAFGDTPQNAYIRHANGTENNPSNYKYTVNGINYQLVNADGKYFYKNISDPTDNTKYYLSRNDGWCHIGYYTFCGWKENAFASSQKFKKNASASSQKSAHKEGSFTLICQRFRNCIVILIVSYNNSYNCII